MKNIIILFVILLVVLFVGAKLSPNLLNSSSNSESSISSSPSPSVTGEPVFCTQEAKTCPDGSSVGRSGPKCEFSKCPETVSAKKAGWKTYKNYSYGFEFSYPSKYKEVSDKYGWPNSIVLLYAGGQSYNLVVEGWSSEAEYKNKYTNNKDLKAFPVKDKFITFLNMNSDPLVEEVIATFKKIE